MVGLGTPAASQGRSALSPGARSTLAGAVTMLGLAEVRWRRRELSYTSTRDKKKQMSARNTEEKIQIHLCKVKKNTKEKK